MYPLTILEWFFEGEWREIGWRAWDPKSAADLRDHGQRLADTGGRYRLVQPSLLAAGTLPAVIHDYGVPAT